MTHRQRLEEVKAWQWDGTKGGFLGRPHWVPNCEYHQTYLVIFTDDDDYAVPLYARSWLVLKHDGRIVRMDNETFIRKYEKTQ